MSKIEIRRFLTRGTFAGKLATVKKDGGSHVVPIWFVLYVDDDGNSTNRVGDIVFTTASTSVKAKNIHRDKRVSICIDDQKPPFSFVTIFGTATIDPYRRREVLKWATKIAGRYIGKSNAKAYGEGEVLVRIKPKFVLAEKHIASWDS